MAILITMYMLIWPVVVAGVKKVGSLLREGFLERALVAHEQRARRQRHEHHLVWIPRHRVRPHRVGGERRPGPAGGLGPPGGGPRHHLARTSRGGVSSFAAGPIGRGAGSRPPSPTPPIRWAPRGLTSVP